MRNSPLRRSDMIRIDLKIVPLIAHIASQANIVRQESLAIDASFEKKRKQADTALKMCVYSIYSSITPVLKPRLCSSSDDSAQSTSTNKSRLRVLQAREQLLQDLFSEAQNKISDLSADEGRYVQLLQGIIVEVRYSMNEQFTLMLKRFICQGNVTNPRTRSHHTRTKS